MGFFERIEKALEKRDKWNLAQSLRHFEILFTPRKSFQTQRKWVHRCYRERRVRFAILQHETYLEEEIEAFLKLSTIESLTAVESQRLQDMQKELVTYDQRFWLHERSFDLLCATKPKGAEIRRWDATARPEEVFSEKQRLRCKQRDGCCGRDCGCCERDFHTHREEGLMMRGHCTMECGCCIRSRGFHEPDGKFAKKRGFQPQYYP